jgi:uncharacterized protein with PIN domain
LLKENIMSKKATSAVKPAAPAVTAEHIANVSGILKAAGEAAASMFALTRDAARAAAEELNPKLAVRERVAEVMARYADPLKEAGHNVKAIFGDCLTLAAAGQQGVTVTVVTKDATGNHDTDISATDAIDQPKHGLRAAASQARELLGIGRASGGGRKPRQPVAVNSGAAPDPVQDALTRPTAQQKFDAFCDALTEYLGDAVYHPQLAAHLLETGWKLQRCKVPAKV